MTQRPGNPDVRINHGLYSMDFSIKRYCCLVLLLLTSKDLYAGCSAFPEDLQPQCQTNLQSEIQSTDQLRSAVLSPDLNIEIDDRTIPLESPLVFSQSDIFLSPSSESSRPTLSSSGNRLLDIEADEIYLSGLRLNSHGTLVRSNGGEDFGLFNSTLEVDELSNQALVPNTVHLDFVDCEGHLRLERNLLSSSQSIMRLSASPRVSSQCLLTFKENSISTGLELELELSDMVIADSRCNMLSDNSIMTCIEPPESGFMHFFNSQGQEFFCGAQPITQIECEGLVRPHQRDGEGLSTEEIVIYTTVAVVGVAIVVAFSVGTFGFLHVALNCGKAALSAAGSAPIATEAARRLTEVVVQPVQNSTPASAAGHEYDVIEPPYQTLEQQPAYNVLSHH